MGVSSITATRSTTDPHVMTVNLGTQWTLFIDERNSQIIIQNNATGGRSTRIWGDPHVDLNNDGTTDFDFWNQTTFNLEGGGKITFETEPWQGNPAMYVVRRIIVTYGDDAMMVDGISQNALNDLGYTDFIDRGIAIDAALADGDSFDLKTNGQLFTSTGGLVTNQGSSGITGYRADADELSESDSALREALFAEITATGLFGTMARARVSLMLTENDYNLTAARAGSGTTDLASLMSLQASLSRLGLIMQGNTSLFDKVVATSGQSGQRIMQS